MGLCAEERGGSPQERVYYPPVSHLANTIKYRIENQAPPRRKREREGQRLASELGPSSTPRPAACCVGFLRVGLSMRLGSSLNPDLARTPRSSRRSHWQRPRSAR